MSLMYIKTRHASYSLNDSFKCAKTSRCKKYSLCKKKRVNFHKKRRKSLQSSLFLKLSCLQYVQKKKRKKRLLYFDKYFTGFLRLARQ